MRASKSEFAHDVSSVMSSLMAGDVTANTAADVDGREDAEEEDEFAAVWVCIDR